MRLARVRTAEGEVFQGIVQGDRVQIIEGDMLDSWKETRRTLALKDVQFLAPISPVNILCFGKNYKAHADESGGGVPTAPLLFIKATSSVIGPEDPIRIPKVAPDQIDYEAELAVVIKKPARHVKEADALDYVLGYTCGDDVTARDCQIKDGQWARSKSFETFCPLGPWIETDLDPSDVRVQGRLNGKIMQDARTSLMIFSVRHLISYLSKGMTLLPGTVLMTGTPAGCGFARKPPVWMKPGDEYEVEIEGVGVLHNSFAAEGSPAQAGKKAEKPRRR